MIWFTQASNFLLSQWIWNVTWGWYHVPINIFVMLFFLKFFGYLRIMPAVLLAFFSQLFSLLVFSVFVIAVPIYALDIHFSLYDCYAQAYPNVLLTSLSLAAIYCVLNIFFFAIVNFFYSLNLRLLILISCVGNGITALLVYRLWGCGAC